MRWSPNRVLTGSENSPKSSSNAAWVNCFGMGPSTPIQPNWPSDSRVGACECWSVASFQLNVPAINFFLTLLAISSCSSGVNSEPDCQRMWATRNSVPSNLRRWAWKCFSRFSFVNLSCKLQGSLRINCYSATKALIWVVVPWFYEIVNYQP